MPLSLPSHHDEIAGLFPDLGVEPLFMALRDAMPQTKTIAPLYRSPICLEVNGGSSDVRPRVQDD
jgi:hypothetical protein